MARKQGQLQEWLHDLGVRYRVILRHGEGIGEEGPDPAAILSRVPDIRVDYPPDGFPRRRRTLKLEVDGKFVTFKPRSRAETPSPGAHPPSRTVFARDRLGRAVPVCRIDGPRRTIRTLVDFAAASILESTEGIDPAAFLVRTLLGKPIEVLLEEDGEPIVGSEVRLRLDRLLSKRSGEPEEALRRELSFLRSLAPHFEPSSDPLFRHMQAMESRLAAITPPNVPQPVPEDLLEQELSALRRLVERRACSELRFGEGKIAGVVNPSPEGSPRGRGPVEFLLSLTPDYYQPGLRLWTLPRNPRQERALRCLGEGKGILVNLLGSRELYRVVDLVLNYIGTNRVGAPRRSISPAGPPDGRRRRQAG